MKSAPPTVPGMPSAYSSPASPRDTAARASRPSRDRIASRRAGGSACVISVEGGNCGAGADERQKLVRRAVDVARTERQHDVARADHLEQCLGDPFACRHVTDVEMAAPP